MKLWPITAPAERWAAVFVLLAGLLLSSTGVSAEPSGDLPGSQTYATRPGETRSLQLEEGSTVELNTRTQLAWFGGERRVQLAEGEAYFGVAPDAARPFRVELPEGDIRVVGTRFDVYRRPDGRVSVTVMEGAVLVEGRAQAGSAVPWHRELYANQQLVYGPEGVIHDTSTLSAASSVLSWREGLVEFMNVPLSEAIEELGRYTDRRIIVGDARAGALHVVGVLSVRDIHAALRRLEKHAPIQVIEEGNTFVLRYREKD